MGNPEDKGDEDEFLDSFEEAQFDPFVPEDIIRAISCPYSKSPDADAKRAALNVLLEPVMEEAEDLTRLVPVLKEVIVDLRVRVEARTYEAIKRAEKGAEFKDKLEAATAEIESLQEKVSEANKQADNLEKVTAEITSLRAAAKKKAEKASDSKDKLEEANAKVESLQEKCSDYKDKLQRATGEIQTLKEKLSGCQSTEKAVEKLRFDNCKLVGDNAGLLAAARAMEAELKKALANLPVGVSETSAPDKARKASAPDKARKAESKVKAKATGKEKDKPEKKDKDKDKDMTEAEVKGKPPSYMDTICETVRERLGPCTRGQNGNPCQLQHPPDCTVEACHANGRATTGCKGWHLFKKYSVLVVERKDRQKALRKEKKKARQAEARKTAPKLVKDKARDGKRSGNSNLGKKPAAPGKVQQQGKRTQPRQRQQQHRRTPEHRPQQQQQQVAAQPFFPPGHQVWAEGRQPMAGYSQPVLPQMQPAFQHPQQPVFSQQQQAFQHPQQPVVPQPGQAFQHHQLQQAQVHNPFQCLSSQAPSGF